MTGTEAVTHEGTKDKVVFEYQIPSGHIGRMRIAVVDIYRYASKS